ncbi:DUF6164 family protein [Lysobacter sp. A3-1-A15]|uniref:DUF6164 family protein n=1 Tax=Novilysobacter viscosus TaxID=3098602 RepID=UPI002EDB9359
MAKLLLNLRNVPDDEADDVRAMLDANRIAFYETQPSRWGISHGGIWLNDADDHPKARTLMDGYQAERRERARADREREQREGTAERFVDVVRRDPLRVLLSGLAIALLLGLMALPAWLLRG